MKELWENIKGYEGYYQVSNKGRIRSLDREITYKARGGAMRTDFLKSRILKPQKHRNGYLSVTLYDKYRIKKQWNIHRLVAFVFIDNVKNKKEVNHINGIKTDNRVENLEWCTRSENAQHQIDIGLLKVPSGEDNHGSKFTQIEANKIREDYMSGGVSQKSLGEKYGCSQATISTIIRNIRYKV